MIANYQSNNFNLFFKASSISKTLANAILYSFKKRPSSRRVPLTSSVSPSSRVHILQPLPKKLSNGYDAWYAPTRVLQRIPPRP